MPISKKPWINSRQGMPPAKGSRGFTLLEVLVAFAVLSIMLMALFQSFSTTILINDNTRDTWMVMTAVQAELLRVEREGGGSMAADQGVYPPGHPLEGYRWLREVTEEQPFPGVFVRRLSLRVLWNNGGRDFSYESSMYLMPR
ncbi:MAG: prepilin-type N-terminal cleavage/methylation domain-containing protein [Deltaproteobacteria bacterium]|nr:prepilin-type N-terminal cleavage/methylation domain-containing protein [Deltaproteobacteria bacterium]